LIDQEKSNVYIIKVGGGAAINLDGIVRDIAVLDDAALIVLGANALRDDIAERMGTPKTTLTSVSGYASVYSDEPAMDAIMMSYAGLRCSRFVELCQQNGINAIGLSGIDGRAVQGERNRGIRIREGSKTILKRDLSGKPKNVNAPLFRMLMDNGYVPVLTIPIVDENGHAINSENDDIVNVLQQALGADHIVQLIEAPGFLDDKNNPDSLVPELSRSEIERREQQVEGRMKRKMLALRRLFESGASRVTIADGRAATPISDALAGKGTIIQ
jgi:acetylglutamate/LysW-gamma-L-alpha-aminoadipate kinase